MFSDKRQVTSDERAVGARKSPPRCRRPFACHEAAFTLVELLVVISIMGIIAALAVPAFKNMGQANIHASASRQLLDDIGRARQLAISQHTTVYMVFVPTNYFNLVTENNHNVMVDLKDPTYMPVAADRLNALNTMSNLVDRQLSGYNFLAYGKVGDQPGQHEWHYLSSWQTLPEGTFIAAAKFLPQIRSMIIPSWQANSAGGQIDSWVYNGSLVPQINGFTNRYFPFPTEQATNCESQLPYLAFDHTGKLVSEMDANGNLHHAYLPLAYGTIGYAHDVDKRPVIAPVQPRDINEIPPGNSTNIGYNIIDVDPLSGRSKLLIYHMK